MVRYSMMDKFLDASYVGIEEITLTIEQVKIILRVNELPPSLVRRDGGTMWYDRTWGNKTKWKSYPRVGSMRGKIGWIVFQRTGE